MNGINAASMQELLNHTTAQEYRKLTAEKQKAAARDQQLRDSCTEFEAVLTSTILKEGLNAAMEMNDEDRDNGSKTYMELANEQMAMFVGRTGMMGIGEQIYNQVKLREGGTDNG